MDPTSDLIRRYLKSNGILTLPAYKRLSAVVATTAEIPWGEGRTIEDVLATKHVGTCTGKHLVLQACLDVLGIKNRPVVCTFRWADQSITYPDNLKALLTGVEWEHGHNFLQVEADGGYIDVDITWNHRLKGNGFRTFPTDWDGKTPFVGVEGIVRRWNGQNVQAMKASLIGSLSPEQAAAREEFLRTFTSWVKSLNGK
jgi:hypothetical protein